MKTIREMELENKFNKKIKYREKKIKNQRMIIGKQQEEIERLKKEKQELEEIINIRECQLEEMQESKTDYTQVNILEMKIEILNNIRNKAIEYIENNNLWTSKEANGYSYMKNECNELLEILKGSDKE